MANYKVAYGRKENMNSAIDKGIIPPGCIILTEDSAEIFFYDLDLKLKTYEERYKFSSYEEASEWVAKYNCKGQILSIHENDKCGIYVVDYDNKLRNISSSNYVTSDRDPTDFDTNYEVLTHWINDSTGSVFILVSNKGRAVWSIITDSSENKDLNYEYTQSTASLLWEINHNLGKHPSVNVVDSNGDSVIGELVYSTDNSLSIKFSTPISGIAYLN